MKSKRFYFDDDEEGVARETSHPDFNAAAKEKFFFDGIDDFSPFGNDAGAEALVRLERWYQETRGKNKITNWLFRYIDGFGFKYQSKWAFSVTSTEELRELEEEDPGFIVEMDRTIIGTGFGQCKITGGISADLKQIVQIAITRQKDLRGKGLLVRQASHGLIGSDVNEDEELVKHYIERMVLMETALASFKEI